MASDDASPCEGACGSRLDPNGREMPWIGPIRDDDHAPVHTVERCRIIALYREFLESALPGWTVMVYPLWQGRLMTRAELVWNGELMSKTQAVPMSAPYGSLPIYAEANAREIRADLEREVARRAGRTTQEGP